MTAVLQQGESVVQYFVDYVIMPIVYISSLHAAAVRSLQIMMMCKSAHGASRGTRMDNAINVYVLRNPSYDRMCLRFRGDFMDKSPPLVYFTANLKRIWAIKKALFFIMYSFSAFL
jgi:hypothetical protein